MATKNRNRLSRLGWATLLIVFAAALGRATPTIAARYELDPDSDDNEVNFHSSATMESFDGHTSKVSGHVEFDLQDLLAPSTWRFEVDLASLDTGIGLRNRHMRENHLEVDEFPTAIFAGGTVVKSSAETLAAGSKATVTVRGNFELHGVSRERLLTLELELRSGGTLSIESEFGVKLSEHDIKRPKFLIMKLADEQEIRVRLIAHPTGRAETAPQEDR